MDPETKERLRQIARDNRGRLLKDVTDPFDFRVACDYADEVLEPAIPAAKKINSRIPAFALVSADAFAYIYACGPRRAAQAARGIAMRQGNEKVLSRDELAAAVTAFRSFEDMAASMRTGYVPTLRELATNGRNTKANRETAAWNRRVRQLRAEVLGAGFRYFANGKIVSA